MGDELSWQARSPIIRFPSDRRMCAGFSLTNDKSSHQRADGSDYQGCAQHKFQVRRISDSRIIAVESSAGTGPIQMTE